MDEIKPDWTSLPHHILLFIASFLPTPFDVSRLSAVSRLFRYLLPPPRPVILKFPRSILTDTDFLTGTDLVFNYPINPKDNIYVFVESVVYAIKPIDKEASPTPIWLVKVEESKPGRVQIKDPLTKLWFKNLPKILPKSLNLLDYQVQEITRSYSLVSLAVLGSGDDPNGIYKRHGSFHIKAVYTSDLDETDDGFAVMARFTGPMLSLWRNVDKKWSHINMGLAVPQYIWDFIYHNEKFYAVATTGFTLMVDSKSLTVTTFLDPPKSLKRSSILYFVEASGDLLLVARSDKFKDQEDFLMVFKLDEKKAEWVEMVDGEELKEKIIFLSDDESSYCVSARELPGCKGNSVYFVENKLVYFSASLDGYPMKDAWGVFSFDDGKMVNLRDFPGYSNPFWPPPSWLQLEAVPHRMNTGDSKTPNKHNLFLCY
ncbi:F-box protein SKIP23-like [Mangifera indica]|uniref:F-box protein SKIP23-like n=1 Tax=Mangifera indica TaxID=29780 RepID=UPI001CFB871C|nr:F-box protein SKIP23-like [Mangifera indica]